MSERPRTGVGTLGEEVRRGKREGRGTRAAGGGGRGRRRSCRRAEAEGVSERSGRAREGKEGGVTRGRARALGARSEASGTGSGLLPAA